MTKSDIMSSHSHAKRKKETNSHNIIIIHNKLSKVISMRVISVIMKMTL